MTDFKNINAFVKHLESKVIPLIQPAEFLAVERSAELVEAEAKTSIGHYQGEAGPFPAWATLSDATLYGFVHPLAGYIPGKIEEGYATEAEHRPLERTGQMRDSYTHVSDGYTAVIGSDDDVALWQELGTPNARYPIPPRSILGGAMARMVPLILEQIASRVAFAMQGLRGRNN